MYTIGNANISVREFFCPEIAQGALSYRDPVAYDVQDRCRSAGITTVAQLIMYTESDLRSKAFHTQHIELIAARLKEQNLQLTTDEQKAFRSGVRGVVAVSSISQPAPLPHSGYASPWIIQR